MIKSDLIQLKDKMDYTEYGGACLFGLSAPVIKAHGSSNANAIYHAIRQAGKWFYMMSQGKLELQLQKIKNE